MVWTKEKPTVPGYYWVKMDRVGIFSEQPPRVVLVGPHPEESEDKLWVLDTPDYDDGFLVEEASEHFQWSSEPINLPNVAGSCGCAATPGQACSACAK